MNRDELLAELTEDILTYAMHGSFPQSEIARSIKPKALDERFEEYELLLDLHFVLQQEVVDFVEVLPERLRSVRTETRNVSRIQRGTVDGRINWGATVKQRYSEHPRDRSIFVCDNRSENYDIPENLVLKKLVSVIHRATREAEEYLRQDYDWVTDTWKENGELIDDLQRVVERNVHVRRIRKPDAYEPTERMLTTAANSRHEIYQDAAKLLRTRRRLFRGESDAIRRLLDETAIAPDDTETLFELFVLFRFVATLENLRKTQPTFQTIRSGRQEVARFEGETELVLYHDTAGGDHGLDFVAVPDEDKDEKALSRTEQVQLVAQEVAENYFGKKYRNTTGRPDVIVLEIIAGDDDREYLITEVKNSTREKTIRQGIKETLEYIAFLRVNEEFVFGSRADADVRGVGVTDIDEGYFGDGWNGMLVVQDLDRETSSVDEQGDNEIVILQASELRDNLETVLLQSVDGLDE